jgi:membrane-associated phospholipid phosphatase
MLQAVVQGKCQACHAIIELTVWLCCFGCACLCSFSFPSGHTSSAVFLIGALCFVLVPITNIYMRESGKQRTTRAWRLPGVLTSSQGSWALWLSSALVTGTGRVLADAHWLTDCVGASFVSMALVSLLARVVCKTTGAGLPAAQLPAKKLM